MDITISSTTGSDTLSAFGLELLITPTPSTGSHPVFTDAQSDPYGDSNYVFYGVSSGESFPPFWSSPFF